MYSYQMPGAYGPYSNNYMQTMQQMQQPMQQASTQQIVKVNGENGARAYQLMPNSSALLLDENNPIVWLAQTDGAGYKTVTPYSISPYTSPETQNLESLNSRIERLESVIYGKSDITNAGTEAAGAAVEHTEPVKVQK